MLGANQLATETLFRMIDGETTESERMETLFAENLVMRASASICARKIFIDSAIPLKLACETSLSIT